MMKQIRSYMCKEGVVIFGRLPAEQEVGGVTTFVYNLAVQYRDLIAAVVDLYPGAKKCYPPGVRVVEVGHRVLKYVVFFAAHLRPGEVMHYNFSTTKGIIPLFFVPKMPFSKWFLMLHNGDQAHHYDQLGGLMRWLVRGALRRFDLIGSISTKQDVFYRRFYKGGLVRVSPHVRVLGGISGGAASGGEGFRVVVSGYPSPEYRHLETLEVLASLFERWPGLRVDLFLYGEGSEENHARIKQRVEVLPFVTLHQHADAATFHRVLEGASLYLRMNAVDSFGLAVAEAIDRGVDVIATDVCERYPGAYLIQRDQFAELEAVLERHLGGFALPALLPMAGARDGEVSLDVVYRRLGAKAVRGAQEARG